MLYLYPEDPADTREIHTVCSLRLCAAQRGESRTVVWDRHHPNRTGSYGEEIPETDWVRKWCCCTRGGEDSRGTARAVGLSLPHHSS